ncbi:MAG: hypothetical protein ACLP59_20375 [Bryobacteraceae bacterium]
MFHTARSLLLLSLSPVAWAQQGAYDQITDYHIVNQGGKELGGITGGSDGAVWFADFYGNQIGRITTHGYIYFYFIPTANSGPLGIAQGADGALWFTEFYANQIARLPVHGSVTEYPIPTAGSGLNYGIVAGPDGAIWFTEGAGNKIGRITTAGVITEYPVPTAGSEPYAITAGPDGALWFTESQTYKVGRITTDGAITEYPVGPEGALTGIAAGPDGALWFLESGNSRNRIGRITTAGSITEYPVPTEDAELAGITRGPDGALWFTENQSSKIGRITTTGILTEYATAYIYPQNIASGPHGDLWFTEYGNNIGRARDCGLGFSATLAGRTLTMNFDLGIDVAATLNVLLRDSSGPIGEPYSQAMGPVAPPQEFTKEWHNVPNLGELTVQATLTAGPGKAICSEWISVNTAQ